jgi:hypothetical protein
MAIVVGSRFKITKGCRSLDLSKGVTCRVERVTELGPEWSNNVSVAFRPLNGFEAGKPRMLFACHPNRLADAVVQLNNGDPTKTIRVVEVKA